MILREMLIDDLEQVMEIERELFHVPWTREGFFTFLTREDAMFLVVEEKEQILGYCGLLMVLDDVTSQMWQCAETDKRKELVIFLWRVLSGWLLREGLLRFIWRFG